MDTIVSIRKTLKRKAYGKLNSPFPDIMALLLFAFPMTNHGHHPPSTESDSDSSIDHNTNRGYKLKKRARFVKQGRLANSNGPAAYKEVCETLRRMCTRCQTLRWGTKQGTNEGDAPRLTLLLSATRSLNMGAISAPSSTRTCPSSTRTATISTVTITKSASRKQSALPWTRTHTHRSG